MSRRTKEPTTYFKPLQFASDLPKRKKEDVGMYLARFIRYDEGRLFWKVRPHGKVNVGDEITGETVMIARTPVPLPHVILLLHGFSITAKTQIVFLDNNPQNLRIENIYRDWKRGKFHDPFDPITYSPFRNRL